MTRLSIGVNNALSEASRLALTHRHNVLSTEHLLYQLMCMPGLSSAAVLRVSGVEIASAESTWHSWWPDGASAPSAEPAFGPRIQHALIAASRFASDAGQSVITSGHALSALAADPDCADFLNEQGVEANDLIRRHRSWLREATLIRDASFGATRVSPAVSNLVDLHLPALPYVVPPPPPSLRMLLLSVIERANLENRPVNTIDLLEYLMPRELVGWDRVASFLGLTPRYLESFKAQGRQEWGRFPVEVQGTDVFLTAAAFAAIAGTLEIFRIYRVGGIIVDAIGTLALHARGSAASSIWSLTMAGCSMTRADLFHSSTGLRWERLGSVLPMVDQWLQGLVTAAPVGQGGLEPVDATRWLHDEAPEPLAAQAAKQFAVCHSSEDPSDPSQSAQLVADDLSAWAATFIPERLANEEPTKHNAATARDAARLAILGAVLAGDGAGAAAAAAFYHAHSIDDLAGDAAQDAATLGRLIEKNVFDSALARRPPRRKVCADPQAYLLLQERVRHLPRGEAIRQLDDLPFALLSEHQAGDGAGNEARSRPQSADILKQIAQFGLAAVRDEWLCTFDEHENENEYLHSLVGREIAKTAIRRAEEALARTTSTDESATEALEEAVRLFRAAAGNADDPWFRASIISQLVFALTRQAHESRRRSIASEAWALFPALVANSVGMRYVEGECAVLVLLLHLEMSVTSQLKEHTYENLGLLLFAHVPDIEGMSAILTTVLPEYNRLYSIARFDDSIRPIATLRISLRSTSAAAQPDAVGGFEALQQMRHEIGELSESVSLAVDQLEELLRILSSLDLRSATAGEVANAYDSAIFAHDHAGHSQPSLFRSIIYASSFASRLEPDQNPDLSRLLELFERFLRDHGIDNLVPPAVERFLREWVSTGIKAQKPAEQGKAAQIALDWLSKRLRWDPSNEQNREILATAGRYSPILVCSHIAAGRHLEALAVFETWKATLSWTMAAGGGRSKMTNAQVNRQREPGTYSDAVQLRSSLALRFLVSSDDHVEDSPVAAIDPSQLRELIWALPKGITVLIPSTGPAGGFLLRVHDGQVDGETITEWTSSAFSDIAMQLVMPDGDLEGGITAAGLLVTDRLIAAIPPGTQEVMIVSGELMSLIPLHTAKNSSGACLLDFVAATYASNLRFGVMGLSRSVVADPINSACIVTNPSPTSMQPLAYAQDEVQYLRGRVPQLQALNESSATRQAVHAMLLNGGDVFHFVGHCVSGMSFDRSFFVLSENSTISSNEVSWMELSFRLAFLAGCVSSRGSLDVITENACIATSFVLAGCRGVVGAITRINDLPSALIANKFYAEWLDHGHAPSEALRRAQLWLRDATWVDVFTEFPWAGGSSGLITRAPDSRDVEP